MDFFLQYLAGHHNNIATLAGVDFILFAIKNLISLIGTVVILIGSVLAAGRYCVVRFTPFDSNIPRQMDDVRLQLGQSITLGLEFIVAADILETTMAPDYYSVGILCIVVFIRTFLNYFLNKEILVLRQQGS
ncbi:MAG: DUF1622 domain-containing protein [Gammaproteobacteria bacterium]|nr:DUF1622 domain-containing protein [Gammaproteobacteria bacterium]